MPHPVEHIHPRSLKHLTHHHEKHLLKGKLWLKILIGMFLGLVVGFILGPSFEVVDRGIAEAIGDWLAMPGYFFLTLIQMTVVPLVFASVIRGIAASEDMERLKKMGIRLVIYFLITTTIAITIGLGAALIIEPGNYFNAEGLNITVSETEKVTSINEAQDQPTIPETIVSLFPKNPLNAMVQAEMLQIVLFSVIVGLALVSLQPKDSKPMIDLLGSIQSACLRIVRWAMILAPIAVFGLLAEVTIKTGIESLLGVGVYMLTVLLGLVLLLGVYLIIVLFVAKRSPLQFLNAIREVQLLAFSTSSSAAVMPLSIKTAEEKLHVRPSTAQLVVPVGATVNMDGTALYQGVATIFLAQVFGVDLNLGAMLMIIITAVGASIGSPAAPGVGIVILSIVLTSVGVPATGIGLILGVDRILDMCRTAINVSGDLVACTVMDRFVGSKKTLEEEQEHHEQMEVSRKKSGEDVIIHQGKQGWGLKGIFRNVAKRFGKDKKRR